VKLLCGINKVIFVCEGTYDNTPKGWVHMYTRDVDQQTFCNAVVPIAGFCEFVMQIELPQSASSLTWFTLRHLNHEER
jgi:hypothetical protein